MFLSEMLQFRTKESKGTFSCLHSKTLVGSLKHDIEISFYNNFCLNTVFPHIVAAATRYSFLGIGVRQLFKGGNYSKEETIDFFLFFSVILLSLE